MASEAEAAVTDTVPDQFDPCWVIFWNETVTSPDEKQYTDWIGNYLFYQPIGQGGRDQGYARKG